MGLSSGVMPALDGDRFDVRVVNPHQ